MIFSLSLVPDMTSSPPRPSYSNSLNVVSIILLINFGRRSARSWKWPSLLDIDAPDPASFTRRPAYSHGVDPDLTRLPLKERVAENFGVLSWKRCDLAKSAFPLFLFACLFLARTRKAGGRFTLLSASSSFPAVEHVLTQTHTLTGRVL